MSFKTMALRWFPGVIVTSQFGSALVKNSVILTVRPLRQALLGPTPGFKAS